MERHVIAFLQIAFALIFWRKNYSHAFYLVAHSALRGPWYNPHNSTTSTRTSIFLLICLTAAVAEASYRLWRNLESTERGFVAMGCCFVGVGLAIIAGDYTPADTLDYPQWVWMRQLTHVALGGFCTSALAYSARERGAPVVIMGMLVALLACHTIGMVKPAPGEWHLVNRSFLLLRALLIVAGGVAIHRAERAD